jgi:hypothetical protein
VDLPWGLTRRPREEAASGTGAYVAPLADGTYTMAESWRRAHATDVRRQTHTGRWVARGQGTNVMIREGLAFEFAPKGQCGMRDPRSIKSASANAGGEGELGRFARAWPSA